MNLTVHFGPIAGTALQASRAEYLAQLPEAQESLLEVMVDGSQAFQITGKEGACGHLLVTGEASDTLIEFHLSPKFWVFGEVVLKQAIAALGLKVALVKSFDALFLSSALDLQTRVTSKGLLVRDFVERALPAISRIQYSHRIASSADLELVLSVRQEVFTHPGRLKALLNREALLLFEKGPSVVGFGIIRAVLNGGKDVDLGIAVDLPFRNKGYSVYMFRDLVRMCHQRGLNPVAGCSRGNDPSRRMGERVGMVARYRLLEMRF